MASKQQTLFDTWKCVNKSSGQREGQHKVVPGWSRGRGRGGNGSVKRKLATAKGQGGKRGRGRGHNNSVKYQDAIITLDDDDDDDALCETALRQIELAEGEICKAFSTANKATDLPGFDSTAGQLWIYPTNQPLRDYQFSITKTALFNNTLVCLPTGLGKTFIAAVVMFNFHRWYPKDIIVFMAPTKPLVTQQLEACHNIVGINPSKTAELTGQILPKKRDALWTEKNVFFLTPQVIQSDIARGVCPVGNIRCVVIDEAHKALGNYSYSVVIDTISKVNRHFRVLALSATPGSDVPAVQQVLKNLLISRIELRSENSTDILPYLHSKNIEKIVVPLDNYLTSVYEQVLDRYQYFTGKLMKACLLSGRDGSSFTKFQLLQARERFRKNPPIGIRDNQKGYHEVDFATCISLAHCIHLLLVHGLRSFYSFLDGVLNRAQGTPAVAAALKKSTNFVTLLNEIQEKLNISVENSSFNLSASGLFSPFDESFLNNSNQSDSSDKVDYLLSHPKMKVLRDIVVKHFESCRDDSTRVMIFSEFRDSVQEIGNMLNTVRPLVKPMVFIGQAKKSAGAGGRGLKQKEQAKVIQKFKDGDFNVLVATSVGEEGLDIGEVDLIICYDASKSPTRSVQRMGRTGRQREGKIIFLLTKGKEEAACYSSFRQSTNMSKNITDSGKLQPYLYPVTPRMVPLGIDPQCFKMNIVLSSEQETNSYRSDYGLSEDDEPISFDDSDFVLLPKKSKKEKKNVVVKLPSKKKSSTSSTSMKKLKNGDHGSASGKGNEPTLTQCVQLMETKTAGRSQTNEFAGAELITIDDDDGDPTNNSVNSGNYHYEGDNLTESHVVEENLVVMDDNYELLYNLLDIEEEMTPQSSIPPCVYILPPSKNAVQWNSAYDKLALDNILLTETELLCLREEVDSSIFLGSLDKNCRCGNIKMVGDDDHMMETFVVENKSDDDHNIALMSTFLENDDGGNVVDLESKPANDSSMDKSDEFMFDSVETNWDPDEVTVLSITKSSRHPSPPNALLQGRNNGIRSESVVGSAAPKQKFTFRRKTNGTLSGQNNPDSSKSTSTPNINTSVVIPANSTSLNNCNSSLLKIVPSSDLNRCHLNFNGEETLSSKPSSLRRIFNKKNKPKDNSIIFDDDTDFIKGTSSSEDGDNENDVAFKYKPSKTTMDGADNFMFDSDETNWDPEEKVDQNLKKDCVFSPALQNFQLKGRPSTAPPPRRQGNSSFMTATTPSMNTSPVIVELSPKTPINFQVTPSRRNSSPNNDDLIMTPSPDMGPIRSSLRCKRHLISSEETPPYKRAPVSRVFKNKPGRNPFVLDEAEDDESGTSITEEDGNLNEENSFVVYEDEDEGEHLSNSQQQAMYLRSVKDVIPNTREEVLLPPQEHSENWQNTMNDDYEYDSFCSDDVEYADVGVYTQAMITAREQLDVEMTEGGCHKKVLRPRK